jgi:hypothetical protein
MRKVREGYKLSRTFFTGRIRADFGGWNPGISDARE